MKKFLATAMALAAITAAFTGCSNNNTSSGSSSAADSSTTSGTSQAEAPAADRTVKDLAEAVNGCVEWPAMEEITDGEIIKSLFNLDVDMLDEYYVSNALMSVHLNEIIIVKPKAGNEETVKSQLDEHFAYIKDGAAFYPDQEIAAAGSVEGVTSDGYYYIIVHQIGSQIAEIMEAYKPGDEITKLEVPEPTYDETVPTDEIGTPIIFGTGEGEVDINAPTAGFDGVDFGVDGENSENSDANADNGIAVY